ncbi:MAG: hypothetical protein WC100_01395 [Sterolibacterium sp.]
MTKLTRLQASKMLGALYKEFMDNEIPFYGLAVIANENDTGVYHTGAINGTAKQLISGLTMALTQEMTDESTRTVLGSACCAAVMRAKLPMKPDMEALLGGILKGPVTEKTKADTTKPEDATTH